jgi:hypothetical protein
VAQAVPAAPPPPVGDLDLARGDDGSLRLTWRDPGRGEVEILRCGKRPEQAPGTTRPRAELFALGQPVRRIAPATCEDRDPPAGLVFYAAVTRDGDLATLGAVLRATNLPEVADLEARFLGRSIRCTWTWPPDCPRCAVAWRHDRYPLAHDEAEARMQILSAGQYQRRGCFEIPVADGVRRDHYVSVFAGAAGTHEDLFSGAASPGARRLLPLGRGGRVAYSLTPVRKRWPPGALDGYRLTVGAETRLAAPELVLVRFRGKRAPTSPAGGDVVLRIEPRTLGPGRDHVVSLKPAVLGRRPFVLRLFLADDRDYARFEIRHPSPGTLAFT